jgi:hypothetical protein
MQNSERCLEKKYIDLKFLIKQKLIYFILTSNSKKINLLEILPAY